jgi:hypothetical protein
LWQASGYSYTAHNFSWHILFCFVIILKRFSNDRLFSLSCSQ